MITDFSAPIMQVYADCTDQILINIARHFEFGGNTGESAKWQLKKLAEMGQLTQENIAIIAEHTGQNSQILRLALENAAYESLKGLEPEFAKAAARGLLSAPAAPMMSPAVKRILNAYSRQAMNQLNLVNTVMLRSSLAAYRKVVANTAVYEKQLEQAQQILNSKTGEVALGISSRNEALRRAIKQMADAGLTGFTDRSGRNWSPEAYVNMDIRTTAGNVATQAAFTRNEEYGNDLITVRILSGARPGCYPHQGKVYCTSNRSGKVEDLNGNMIQFEALSSTTYGQPAGIFGINCHHSPPNPFIPGYSVLRGEVPPKDENDAKYAQSQEQRRLEREVRYAKRDAAMANAMGDKEAFDKASLKVKQKQADYKRFVDESGRTTRLDRTQINGYDKSVAGRVTQGAIKTQKRQTAKMIADEINANFKNSGAPEKLLGLSDEVLKHTVNVKALKSKKLPYGFNAVAPKGATLTEMEVQAGYGTSSTIRDLPRLYADYPTYDPQYWQKKSGTAYGESYHYVIHWYENSGNVPIDEIKLKGMKQNR